MNLRNTDIYRMYLDSKTYVEIGQKYGISRERVRQIVEKQKRRNPVDRWIDTFGTRTARLLDKAGIYSEKELHKVYERDGMIEGISKKNLKNMNYLLETPLWEIKK